MAEQELLFDNVENPILIDANQTSDEDSNSNCGQYWWLNIVPTKWAIEGDSIGTKKPINFNLSRRRNNDDIEDKCKEWLDCYLIDRKDNPHFGEPIAHQELAISLLDYCGIPVNKDSIKLAKRSINNNLDDYIRKFGIVCNPESVLTTENYLRDGTRPGEAWMYRLNKEDGTIPERPKGVRKPRTKQKSNKVFYFYRKDEVPQFPLDKKHIGNPNYVQPASAVDPEKDYPSITEIRPYSGARKGDIVFACDTKSKCLAAKLVVESVDKTKISFEIIAIYHPTCPMKSLKEPYSKLCGDNPLEILRITDTDAVEIEKRIEKAIGSKPVSRIPNYSKGKLKKEAFVAPEIVDAILEASKVKKNIILQGAPGVGKSYLARLIAYALMEAKDDSRICYIQFHPNYTYEDFIVGYKPNEAGIFELQEGVFMRFCETASNHDDKDFFFIIDEINRGNLTKIFGEAFTLIDKDHRDECIKLASTNIPMKVPKNVHIIGLMNTADRSLAMLDMALRRRFAFIPLEPGFQTTAFKSYQKKLDSTVFDKLIEKIVELNTFIAGKDSSLDEGLCIGHSYFCNFEDIDAEELKARLKGIVKYDINPMLKEYWFGEDDTKSKYKKFSEELLSVFE